MKIQNGRTHFSYTFSQCSYLWRITLVLTTAFTNLFLKRQKWIFWKYFFFFAPWQHGEECAAILTIPAVDFYPRTMQKYQEMAHRGYSQQLVQHTHPRLCHFFDFLMFCGVFWSIWWRHQKVLMTMAPKLLVLETSIPFRYLVKMWGQLTVRCALRVALYLWGVKISFVGKWVEGVILTTMGQYTFFDFISFLCTALFCFAFWEKNVFYFFFLIFFSFSLSFFSDWQKWATIVIIYFWLLILPLSLSQYLK